MTRQGWTFCILLMLAYLATHIIGLYCSTPASAYVPSCAWDCGPTTAIVIDSIKIGADTLWYRQRTILHTPGKIDTLGGVWINAGSMQQ